MLRSGRACRFDPRCRRRRGSVRRYTRLPAAYRQKRVTMRPAFRAWSGPAARTDSASSASRAGSSQPLSGTVLRQSETSKTKNGRLLMICRALVILSLLVVAVTGTSPALGQEATLVFGVLNQQSPALTARSEERRVGKEG